MQIDTQIREQLARELARSGAPALGSLVFDAGMAGQRRARRQRYGFAAAGAAGLAAVVTLGVITLSGGPNRGATVADSAASGSAQIPTASSSQPRASTATTPTGTTAPSATAPTTGQRVVVVLRSLVHAKNVTEVDFGNSRGYAYGTFLENDGHGAATVSASVSDQPATYSPATGMNCPPDEPGFTCATRTLSGGIEARIVTAGPYGPTCTEPKCSIVDLRVEIKRPDGTYVIAEAYNGPQGHGRAATRTSPILDTNRLIAIATDPRWGLTSDAADVAAAARSVHASDN